jgi:membrane-associated protease RseP (regulator of RpoE activity)
MIILFISSLIILIILHELAHLIVAKKINCNVEKFSIGFGKSLYSKKIGNTIYQISPVIFGGYCTLEGELERSESPNAFVNLQYRNKIFISLAGCFVNIISGILCCFLAKRFNLYWLWYFGMFSIMAGVGNLIPLPGLDGSYPLLMLLEKFMDKDRSILILNKLVKISTRILMLSNAAILPWFIFKGIYLLNTVINIYWMF